MRVEKKRALKAACSRLRETGFGSPVEAAATFFTARKVPVQAGYCLPHEQAIPANHRPADPSVVTPCGGMPRS